MTAHGAFFLVIECCPPPSPLQSSVSDCWWLHLIRSQLAEESWEVSSLYSVIQSRAGEGLGMMDLTVNRLMTTKESKRLEICYCSALIWFLRKG